MNKSRKEWKAYDGSYALEMRHKFKLYLKPNCEYSRKRYQYRTTETKELDYLHRHYKSKLTCCFDIGANIGYWSKFLICRCHTKTLYAFEPFPATFKILNRNLKNHKNARCIRKAISNQERTLKLFVESDHSGDNRPVFTPGRKSIIVQCTSLDRYVEKNKIKEVNFIKIDIQGGEINALRGANKVINKFYPLLMVEIAPEIDLRINSFIKKFICQKKYRAFCVKAGQKKLLEKKDISKFSGNIFLEPM